LHVKYGKLTYLRDVEPTKFELIGRKSKHPRLALWRCDCGKEKRIKVQSVTGGDTRSCGCGQAAAWRGYVRADAASKR
jgi:hypothetical protein